MDTRTSKRTGVLLGATILAVVVGVNLLRRHVEAAPSPTRAGDVAASAVASIVPAAAPASAAARRARDAMRAEIFAAMRRRAATASPAAPSPAAPRASAAAPAGEEEPHGYYEPSYIQAHVREDMFPLMRQCYEGALARRPTLGGRLVLAFDIVGDPDVGGIVEEAGFADDSDLKDPEMETCVRESLMTLTFDKPPTGGGRVSVKYPVAFAPGDDDEPRDAGKR